MYWFARCLCCLCRLFGRMFDILQHSCRIVFMPRPQDRKDDPQDLAGNHDQRLHLLQRIIRPRRIVHMQRPEFFCMGYCRSCCLEEPIPQPFASSMTDLCFSLMLAGTAGYKPKPAQLLDLLHIIETPDVPHFCQDPGQNVFSDALNSQQVLCVLDLPAFLMESFLDLIEFRRKIKDLLYKASDRFLAAACSVLQTYTFRCKLHDLFRPAVSASPELCLMPDLPQPLRA